MRSVFGPLLFGILPLLAVGCVLPERSLGRAEDLGFRPRGSGVPRVSSESPSSDSITSKTPPKSRRANQDEVYQREMDRPSEQEISGRATQTSDADLSQLTPGHSTDAPKSLDHVAWPSTTSSRSAVSAQIDQRSVGKANLNSSGKSESLTSAEARTVYAQPSENRTAENAIDSPVQRSLEKDGLDPETTMSQSRWADSKPARGDDSQPGLRLAKANDPSAVPLWSDRPDDRAPVQPAAATGQTTKASGTVRQISQTDSTDSGKPRATGSLTTASWQAELDQLIAKVEQELVQIMPGTDPNLQNDYLRKQAHLRLLYLIAQRQEDAMTAIPGVDSFQQEYWQQMVWAMSNSLDTVQFPEPSERAAQTVPPLSAALRQMREQASLSIKNMTFCRKISYFGNYERFPRNDFTAGHEVLLYTEIENFVSVPTGDGEYRTSLKSLIEIADSQGRIVWTKGFPSTEDFCRNPRRDYFHNYQFYIPEDLSTGAYTLKLTIIDELSKKRASNSLNFVLK